MPRLRIKEKDDWKDVKILSSPFVIGRSSNCDHTIDSGYVSRHHCELIEALDGWAIRDCNSKLGTAVNGRRVEEIDLEYGDNIRLGGKLDAVFMAEALLAHTETMRVVQPEFHKDRERLVCLDGPIAEKTFRLNKPLFKIGRTDDNDIHIPIDTISKQHAELTAESGKWILRDLNSGNGTFVNEEQIDHKILKAGDLIRFDRVGFRFEDTHYRVDKSGTRIRAIPMEPTPLDTQVPFGAMVLKKDPIIDRPTNRHKRSRKSSAGWLLTLLILLLLAAGGYGGYLVYQKWVNEHNGDGQPINVSSLVWLSRAKVKLVPPRGKHPVTSDAETGMRAKR